MNTTLKRQAPARNNRPFKKKRLAAPIFLSAALLYVALPAGAGALKSVHDRDKVASVPQRITPVPTLQVSDVEGLEDLQRAWDASPDIPLLLTYHDIAPAQPSQYTVTPEHFAQQMALLELLGAHTLSAEEFARYTRGATLPRHSVMISFDDGTRGLWSYADKILAQHGFRGVSFVITGRVGTRSPYYLTWPEIESLAATGRWDFESHTYLGHVRLPIDERGEVGSFVGALLWLPKQHRQETLVEHRARVSADLDRSIADLARRGLGKGRLFAFPFSDFGAQSVPGELSSAVRDMVRRRFSAVFRDADGPEPLDGPFDFSRLDIGANATVGSIVANLREVIRRTEQQRLNAAQQAMTS